MPAFFCLHDSSLMFHDFSAICNWKITPQKIFLATKIKHIKSEDK